MLYYIHGYESNPNGTKGILFKEKLNAKAIQYRNCKPKDISISNCLNKIAQEIKNKNNVVLIGSSLGGFLAATTALNKPNVTKIILLNPALIPPSIDINTINDMPKNILKEMKDDNLFKKKIKAEIHIFTGTKDELIPLNWSIEFACNQEATIRFLKDNHRFEKNLNILPELIKRIIDKKH